MPFIDNTQERDTMQGVQADDGSIPAEFGETFDAAVGFTFDEGLSISRALNNEGFEARRTEAKKIFDSGVSRETYTDHRGRINYDRLSQEYDTIKPDTQLNNEKKALLADRRKYYNSVMKRSDSMAGNFAGSATAFMLDPVNVATMGVGTPFAVAKGATVISKALYGAGGAAAINLGTEALIQPFVLDYKLDVDSPYTAEDAISNIAMAAGGGLVFGGAMGGISGWLTKVRGEAVKIKLTDKVDAPELKMAVEQIDEMLDTLKDVKKVDIEPIRAETITKLKTEMNSKLMPDERIKGLKSEVSTIKAKIEEINASPISEDLLKTKIDLQERMTAINESLDANKAITKKLASLEEGKLSKADETRINEDAHMKQVDAEANHLRKLEEERTRINRTPDNVEVEPVKANDAEIEAKYKEIKEPVMVKDGEIISSKKVLKQFDDDIEGLESLRTCLLG